MKKIISFSLWGTNPKYTVGAVKNASLQKTFYPEWTCRFYCDSTVPFETLQTLRDLGSEVLVKDVIGDWKFAVERFKAIDDEVSHVIFRDTDSRFTSREVAAVSEWLASNKTLHVMKDHPYHGGFPILAGMWGLKKERFDLEMELLTRVCNNGSSHYHYDQNFLRDYVWRYYSHDCLVHDEFFGGIPFPTKREGTEYVGKPLEADDTPSLPQAERYFT